MSAESNVCQQAHIAADTNAKSNVIFVKYHIGQRVRIDAIETRGVVRGINISSGSIEYQIAYFDDDKVRRTEWLESNEISS